MKKSFLVYVFCLFVACCDMYKKMPSCWFGGKASSARGVKKKNYAMLTFVVMASPRHRKWNFLCARLTPYYEKR